MSARTSTEALEQAGATRQKRDPVRAYSYDVDDSRARPGRKIGDGSVEHGSAFKTALLHAAKQELIRQHAEKYRGPCKLQWTDIAILEHMLRYLIYATGDWFVPYKIIAGKIGKEQGTAKISVERLEYHGFLSHVRRSEKRDDVIEGAPGPRRRQACNAYYFNLHLTLSKKAWADFWEQLKRSLARIGPALRKQAHMFVRSFNSKAAPSPRQPKTPANMTAEQETLANIAALKSPAMRAIFRDMGREIGFFEGGSASP